MNRMYLIIGVLLLVLAVGAIVYFVWIKTPTPDSETFDEEFELILKSYEGEDVRLSEFDDTALVVQLWATWCPHCALELEALARLKARQGDTVRILAVNRAEPLDTAQSFSQNLEGNDQILFLLDPEDALFKDVDGYAVPETLFIQKGGDILFHQRGPMSESDMEKKIQELTK